MKHKSQSPESGFTLIETSIAMMIFSIALIALAQLLTLGVQMNTTARTTTSALSIAQQQIEQNRNAYGITRATYDTLATGTTTNNYNTAGQRAGNGDTVAYVLTTTVANGQASGAGTLLDQTGQPAFKTVTVNVVSQINAYGAASNVTLNVYLARPPT